MSADDRLFAAIQRACSPRAWSRGVELSRAGAVASEPSDDPDERVLRVAVKGQSLSPAVTLWPADGEWSCECPSREDACFHVAAAVIALRRAREAGQEAPSAGGRTARVGYRLRRAEGGLAFDRVLVLGDGGGEAPLTHTLTELTRGRVEGSPAVMATAADLAVEVALGALRRGVLPGALMKKILPSLAPSQELRLDDAPITAEAEPVRPHVKVSDHGDGVRIALVRNPAITEVFANGVARCGEVLRPVAGSGLGKDEVARLKAGAIYPREQLAEVVSEVLPRLRAQTSVHVRAKNLPTQTADARPRLAFETERQGDALAVLPLLVYAVGDGPAIARVDGDRLVPLGRALPERRDPTAERRLLQAMEQKLQLAPGRKQFFAGEAAFDLLPRLRAQGELRGDGHRDFVRAAPLRPRAIAGGGPLGHGLGVLFETTGPDGQAKTIDAAAVVGAWERGESLVPLLDGGFAPLPHDWLARFGPHLQFLLAAREPSGALARHALPALAALQHELDAPASADLAGLRALAGGYEGLPAAALPGDLRADLRDYQKIGVRWLGLLRGAGLGALLADDMGLGKTLQALATLRAGERALVVAPTSVAHAWAEQLVRFRPGLRVSRYTGPRRARDPAADVTLTTYAILRLDDELLRCADDRGAPWSLVILDEAQTIKNPESQVAQAAFSLRADARVALTGTPVENRLDELWSLFHFLNPGLLGGRRDFQERLARPIADGSAAAAVALQARIRPFLLRRRKQEVARELPPRTELVLRCQLGAREREVYQAIQSATRAEVIAQLEAGKGVIQALEALLRLRQAACHTGLLPGQDAARSSKVDLLVDTLAEITAEGHKALVFSQWTGLLDLIEGPLRGEAIDFCRLDGSTRDRGAVVDRFQSESGPPVMLISLKAGGTGLTLTAADHVFLVDPWWNPAVEDQAADRAHRIGQDRPVMIHRLVAEDTVEERILALQAAKRAIAEVALGGALDGAQGGQSLSREDLLALLD